MQYPDTACTGQTTPTWHMNNWQDEWFGLLRVQEIAKWHARKGLERKAHRGVIQPRGLGEKSPTPTISCRGCAQRKIQIPRSKSQDPNPKTQIPKSKDSKTVLTPKSPSL